MVRARPSMRELITGRSRRGFVGRGAERAAFRENLELAAEDERHRFLFHVHGNAGVGKSFLVRELEQLARERGALTAYVDESVGSVPEAMAAISDRFALQGHRFKELDRLLATHRERRHEAESTVVETVGMLEPQPSPASMTAARAGLVGLGLVPGVGAFAGAVDPAQLAQGADRLRAGLSARFRSQEDVQLVLSPERVLTPVLLTELADAADAAPWLVLFFDTYERTGPFLDGWLHDVMTTDKYGGSLPANTVVVTAGQRAFDTARWGGFADFVTDLPLGPFTDAEARGLLAGKGVVEEPVVEEVLRLTGGLPVLVSTLAEARPADPDDVGDPSATAVERFLKWEQDPARRAVALACALPRRLDADVFRAAVECPDEEADALFGWLRSLPFVSDRGDRVQYHDVVRAPMLRLQRGHSPRGWAERHVRLAETFGRWRVEAEAGLETEELWADDGWRELRLAESYHLLCAGVRSALPALLRDFVDACDSGDVTARRWAQVLMEAGDDADATVVRKWGRDLLAALAEGGVAAALGLLSNRAGFDERQQALARTVRGSALRRSGAYEQAMAEYDRAVALDPELARAYRGRALSRDMLGDHEAAIADLDRAVALAPNHAGTVAARGEHHRRQGHDREAVRDLTRGVELDPSHHFAWASRGAAHQMLGMLDEALADLNRALELNPEYPFALMRRARVWRALGEPARQIADLDHMIRLNPDSAWRRCERGDALHSAGRHEEAVADYDRAIDIDGEHASAYAGRGVCRGGLGRFDEAFADLDRALALAPEYTWALWQRAEIHLQLGSYDRALSDTDQATRLRPDDAEILVCRARALIGLECFAEAIADLDRAAALVRSATVEGAGLAPLLGRIDVARAAAREGSAQ
ncbi:BREX system ATP-binding domain-containing protein [Streptomyces sp. NPDC005808]|uniref:BREX system ATP-binding domain-containing protein n=1 Tax=Streptomyces sp. NPDC005808 TaxID=3364734 RepID=UPI0036CB6589